MDKMGLQTSRISNKVPFVIDSEIPIDDVDAYFEPLEECRALTPLRYQGQLLYKRKGIRLEADIEIELERFCYRCAAAGKIPLAFKVELVLIEANNQSSEVELALEAKDLDVVVYQDPEIDLDRILLESVFMELEGNYICCDECKGLCINCGQNLNLNPCLCK